MATRPDLEPLWAVNHIIDQEDQAGNVVENRSEPTQAHFDNGLTPDEPMPRQWFNWMFWNWGSWMLYLEELIIETDFGDFLTEPEADLLYPKFDARVTHMDNLATQQEVVDSFVLSGYGGIGMNANTALSVDSTVWTTIANYDQTLITNPVRVLQNVANGTLAFNASGVWIFNAKVAVEHNDVGNTADTVMEIRTINTTTATPSSTTFVFPTGRNASTSIGNINLPVEVPVVNIGDAFALQIRFSNNGTPVDVGNINNVDSYYSVTHTGLAIGI